MFETKKHKKTHWLSGAILLLKKTHKKLVNVFLCFFVKKNTKNTLALRCNSIAEKKTKKNWSLYFCVFRKKNTKKQKHIGSLVQFYCWKKDKIKFGQCVFVFFVKKNPQKHICSLVQSFCWKKRQEKFSHCVFVFFVKKKPQKHKNTLGVWCNLCGGKPQNRIGSCTS